MKTTKIIFGALGMAALFALSARAQTVNIDLTGSSNPNYSGLGAASDTGTNWNQFKVPGTETTQSASGLTDSTGGASTVTFALADVAAFNPYAVELAAQPLLSNFVYGNGAEMDFTIGGLTAGAQYNLYIYSQNSHYGTSVAPFTIGATTLTATGAGNQSSFVNGVNYVEFVSLTADGSGNISGFENTSDAGGALNGLQVQAVSEAPEPSSLALMSLVGVGALLFRWRLLKRSV